ncbi:carbamoyl-phosphate synthase large subunit [Thermodesulfovibrio aggregans]|uniref:Carbamoyl phosphate synthase large chain n=1 Tax=Thermodesulfovibrio aggregans TaxID=86166 RepID=A0A0U9HRA0_9BACT|nr:carbamoyl-phosphate synthase large subunit [Thermodesulfovibrio aggregans]GAQ94953.1 carbamoyl-phosphate synthase large subunit [Thermodesulfovibrio aggregans]
MPKRTDIKKILIIGSGPIIIGQACEFDYSGAQACKALKQEGYEVVLVNSNPATIMTDPSMADSTYIEPLTAEILELIIKKERPDALLPTLGGQTALNLAVELGEAGVLEKYSVELIGANLNAIKKAEDRELFKQAMTKIGLDVPRSATVHSLKEGLEVIEWIGFPAILRPAFTLGGTGGGIAYNIEEFKELLERGLKLSPISQVLIEESLLGWKEFELEVMRDKADNVVIICSIENFDPMGVHTGDSITVAPAQTLTDKEYQLMRDSAIKAIREIGVDTGGSNIQFAVNPKNGRMCIIEMNPRVSRSSALASKATGFPIAKIAARLAVGYTLDEIPNDITRVTPASFEPVLDYVVVKIPRFTFEKFPEANPVLTTQMKSVGEVMAIGRTFKEAIGKAIRSLEIGSYGFEEIETTSDEIVWRLKNPTAERLWYIAEAIRKGFSVEEIYELSGIDPWFLNNIKEIIEIENRLKTEKLSRDLVFEAKQNGLSDRRIAMLTGKNEEEIRQLRNDLKIKPVYKLVDTCAAEFIAYTPYMYSCYEREFYCIKAETQTLENQPIYDADAPPTENPKKVIILGSGPNRIGQGIEFDYCCVHAVFGLRELGYETIMVNCNPETVSTDYDTSDRLYFEPLTLEDVLHIVEREKPLGVILQFGGQTPLKLAKALEKYGVNILGTKADAIDRAEDRKRFKELVDKLNLKQPPSGTATSLEKALKIAEELGYPILVRPSYVLGGRAMEIVYDEDSLRRYMKEAVKASEDHPVLIDRYLEDAIEVDVDAISDGVDVVVAGIMQHIEEAGIHSGDSACSLPPYNLSEEIIHKIKDETVAIARELEVRGLMNVQYAIKDGEIYVLEVNPRASRTIPYVSKSIGVPLAAMAAKIMVGKTLKELGLTKEIKIPYVTVKEAIFPFDKFPEVDVILGPEMKSTGEVMGIDEDFGLAYAKAQMSAMGKIPLSGKVFISVKDKDKPHVLPIAKEFVEQGFTIIATRGTAKYLIENGLNAEVVNKLQEGRPNVLDLIKNRQISFIINTVFGKKAQKDSMYIRRGALNYKIPYTTTISGASAIVKTIKRLKESKIKVKSIQEYHECI